MTLSERELRIDGQVRRALLATYGVNGIEWASREDAQYKPEDRHHFHEAVASFIHKDVRTAWRVLHPQPRDKRGRFA